MLKPAILSVLFAALCVSVVPGAQAQTTVSFGSQIIESRIRSIIEIDTGPILDTDLESVTELIVSGFVVDDLSGLEYCLNLSALDLSSNIITDIGPLSSLSLLAELDLSDNRIVDVGPLRNLVSLRSLNLAQNQIVDATALQTNIGLGSGDLVDFRENDLNHDTVCRTIPSLLEAGAQVLFEGACPGQIEGVVTDSTTGQPIASATVVALTIGPDFGFGATDLGGLYVIDDLPSGPYTFAVHAPGYERANREGSVIDSTIEDVSFALTPRADQDVISVTGRVLDSRSGLALVGVEVVAWENVSERADLTYTSGTGEYELIIFNTEAVELNLQFFAPGYVARNVSTDLTKDTDAGETRLTPMDVYTGEIAGRVFDAASGDEIAGARVMAKRVGGIVGFATVTDINGGYSVPNLAAGEYSVQASAGHNEGVRRRVVVDDEAANRDLYVIGEGGVGGGAGEGGGDGGGEGGGEGDGEGAGATDGLGEGNSEGLGAEGQGDGGCAAAVSASRGGVGFASGSVGDLVLLTMTVLALGGVPGRRPHSQS